MASYTFVGLQTGRGFLDQWAVKWLTHSLSTAMESRSCLWKGENLKLHWKFSCGPGIACILCVVLIAVAFSLTTKAEFNFQFFENFIHMCNGSWSYPTPLSGPLNTFLSQFYLSHLFFFLLLFFPPFSFFFCNPLSPVSVAHLQTNASMRARASFFKKTD